MEGISANFYLLNVIVVVALVAYLLWRIPRSQARRRGQESSPKQGLKGLAKELEDMSNQNQNPPEVEESPPSAMFNWNGHSWDAYEVLGIPAGSSRRQVDAAYQQEMAKMDEESRAFIQKAYEAIKKVHG